MENIEPKLAKIEKDVENNRKHQGELSNKIRNIEEWIEEEKKKRVEVEIN